MGCTPTDLRLEDPVELELVTEALIHQERNDAMHQMIKALASARKL